MSRKRNRRRNAQAFLVPAPLVGLVVLALTLTLIYLWMEQGCIAVGQRISGLERDHAGLSAELAREQNKWAAMRAPEKLDMALLKHGIAMGLPSAGQVVRVDAESSAGGIRYARREVYARTE